MKIRCAIIGCGPNNPYKGGSNSIAYAHAWSYQRCPEVELVAAASRTPKNVADFTAEFSGCRGYQDYREMLAREHPDLVSVCAFPPDREAMVAAAVAAGARGVWIEKPFALSLGAARNMMSAAAKTGCRLFVNHQRRYGKPFEWWRDAVQEEKIGELVGIDIAQPGGCLMNFGPHLVDAALFALGPKRRPVRVIGAVDMTSVGNYQGARTEAHIFAGVHMNDETRLTLEAGKKTCGKPPLLRANGTMGFAEIRVEPLAGEGSVFRAREAATLTINSPATNEHVHHSEDKALYIHRALMDIINALQTGSQTRIDADEAYRGLEIIMGAYESARLRQVLTFPIAQSDFPLDLW